MAQLSLVLPDDASFSADDTPLCSLGTPNLASGAAMKLELKTSLPSSLTPKGKYLIAVALSDAGAHTATDGPLR